jgi:hypothetical protein
MKGGVSWLMVVALALMLLVATAFDGSRNTLAFYAGALTVAFLVGTGGYYFKRLPWMAAAIILLCYAGALAWFAVATDVVACPRCADSDGVDRRFWFSMWAITLGILGLVLLAAIAMGGAIGSHLRRAQEE